MNSIFHPDGNNEIIKRINSLTPITHNEWGTMNVSQMLVHCQMPIKVAFGEMQIKAGLLTSFFAKFMKKSFTGEAPLRRDLPTAKEFVVKGHPDFEESKSNLISMISKFASEGPTSIKNRKHPYFGELNDDEWGHLHWKHLDHHLKQFGA